MNRSRGFSQSASDGTVTSAFFAYARCTALELCPNACCANLSGNPHFNARSAHAYRYECSDTPEIPSPSHRCLNSVARSPALTVQRYGKSCPTAGRRFKMASASTAKRDGALRFEFDGRPLAFRQYRGRKPIHVNGEVVHPPQISVHGNFAALQDMKQMLGVCLN